jgi:hypothetical protein
MAALHNIAKITNFFPKPFKLFHCLILMPFTNNLIKSKQPKIIPLFILKI